MIDCMCPALRKTWRGYEEEWPPRRCPSCGQELWGGGGRLLVGSQQCSDPNAGVAFIAP